MAGFHSTASDTWLHNRAKTSRTALHFILARVEISIEIIRTSVGGIPGGGGTHFFSVYVGSDPKNIRNFKHPKKYLKF